MSSRGIPEVLMKKVDEYVDSLAPQVQPRITSELEDFQAKTIDSLEDQVLDAFRSLFKKDSKSSGSSRGVSAPDAYGGQSLPFANEISKLTRSFTDLADEASGDLSDILKLTEGNDGPSDTRSRGGGSSDSSRGMKGFLSTAVNAVQDHLESKATGPGGQKFELEGLLGILSNTVQDAARNPEEKARLISPEIKERVGAKLREQHAPIAEQFTRIALDHIKKWLRGNVSSRDLGDGAKGEIEDQVKGLIKGVGSLFKDVTKQGDSSGSSRGIGDGDRDGDDGESKGFSKLISDKLSTGLAKVHREVRLEFRKVLGGLEKQLFELLPDEFQRPLEKILGGNPFDSQLDRDARSRGDRGFGDDIKAKLVSKLRDLVRKVQEMLRESILGVVSGGHRKFEKHSWVFVQNIVESKVQKYLPKVKITVPDDIGDEGVDVGAPSAGSQFGGGGKPVSSPQGGRVSPPHEQQGRPPYAQGQQQQSQDYRPDHQRPQSPQGYGSGHQQNQSPQDYRPSHQRPQSPQGYRPDHQQNQSSQDYRPGQQRPQSPQGYGSGHQQNQSSQDYRPSHQQHQSQQGYRPDNYQQGQSPDSYRPGHQQRPSQQDDYRPGHQQHQSSQDYRPGNYQQGQSHQSYRPDGYQQSQSQHRPDNYQQGQSQQDYRPDPYQRQDSTQDHRPGQYRPQSQGHSRQDYDQPQGYQQNQSYRPGQRQDDRQDQGGYGRNEGYQKEQGYGQDSRQDQGGYGRNEGYQKEQGYGQDSRQDQGGYGRNEGYEQGGRYGQNPRY